MHVGWILTSSQFKTIASKILLIFFVVSFLHLERHQQVDGSRHKIYLKESYKVSLKFEIWNHWLISIQNRWKFSIDLADIFRKKLELFDLARCSNSNTRRELNKSTFHAIVDCVVVVVVFSSIYSAVHWPKGKNIFQVPTKKSQLRLPDDHKNWL